MLAARHDDDDDDDLDYVFSVTFILSDFNTYLLSYGII